jgi:hypothetical protein
MVFNLVPVPHVLGVQCETQKIGEHESHVGFRHMGVFDISVSVAQIAVAKADVVLFTAPDFAGHVDSAGAEIPVVDGSGGMVDPEHRRKCLRLSAMILKRL